MATAVATCRHAMPIKRTESVAMLFEVYEDLENTLSERQRLGKSTLSLTYKEIFDAALTLVMTEQSIRSLIIEDPYPGDGQPLPIYPAESVAS